MTSLQVEIIIWSIQVGRHHRNVIGAILYIKALTHFQPSNLSNCIRFIRIFQWRCQQRIFFHGLWCFFRIHTSATQKQQFLHLVFITLSYHIVLNLQIAINKIGPIYIVSNNSTHMCRSQKYILRFFIFKEFGYRHTVHQVQFFRCTANQIGITLLLQIVPNGRAHQSAVTCNVYFRIYFHYKYLFLF